MMRVPEPGDDARLRPAWWRMTAELCLSSLLDLGGVGRSLKVLPEIWGEDW